MKLPGYLRISRHNVYIYRRRIPNNLLVYFNTAEIRQSLGTSSRKEGILRARLLTVETDSLFARLRNNMPADDKPSKLLELVQQRKKLLVEQMKNEALQDDLIDARIERLRTENALKAQHEREIGLIKDFAALSGIKHSTIPVYDPNLSEMVNEFLSSDQVELRGNKPSTVRKDGDALNLFIAIIGDKPISKVNQADAALFAKTIPTYRTRQLTKRAPNTINNYMGSISKFSAWVAAYHSGTGHIKLDFSVLRHKSREREDEQRPMFEQDEIEAIFHHAKMAKFRVAQPAKYWLLIISLYTGARLEEICQLDPNEDIYQGEGGIWAFDFNEEIDTSKSLKTKSSKRVCPIHSKLIELGFLKYVEQVKGNPAKRLFPDATIRDGRKGKNIGKQANYFINTNVGIKDKTLYCFRHTMATKLKRMMVEEPIAAAVLGHQHGGITYSRYGKNYLLEVLHEALEKVDFGLTHTTPELAL